MRKSSSLCEKQFVSYPPDHPLSSPPSSPGGEGRYSWLHYRNHGLPSYSQDNIQDARMLLLLLYTSAP